MTTAHRPTWNPALASKDQGGNRSHMPSLQFSAKDLPGHTRLKFRQPGQNTSEEVASRNLKEELLAKEQAAARKKRTREETEDVEMLEAPVKRALLTDGSIAIPSAPPSGSTIDFSADADDSSDDSSDGSANENESDSSDSDDSSDDEEEIRKELEKIRAERALAAAKKFKEVDEAKQVSEHEKVLRDNPLLWKAQSGEDYSLEKKWYDDVIFKNQARDLPKQEKRFINDTVRNDFHRKFLNKYVK